MHIVKRNKQFQYCRRIPADIIQFYQRAYFRFSLKVQCKKQAEILCKDLDSRLDLLVFYFKTGVIDSNRLLENLREAGFHQPEKSGVRLRGRDIKALFQKYEEERLSSGRWIPKTALENKRSFTLFIEWAGNLSLEQIDHKLLLEYREVLRKLPPNLNTSPLTRDKTLNQILLMDHKRVLSVAQANKYLVTLTAFFSWLQEHEFISHNPAHHLLLPKAKREKASEERLAYSVTEIKLFNPHYWLTDKILRTAGLKDSGCH